MRVAQFNIDANGLTSSTEATALEWGYEFDTEAVRESHGPFDLLIGSDLLYAPEVFPELLETLVALSTPGRTEVMLVHPVRHTEDIFYNAAAEYFEEVRWQEEVEDGIWTSRLIRRDD